MLAGVRFPMRSYKNIYTDKFITFSGDQCANIEYHGAAYSTTYISMQQYTYYKLCKKNSFYFFCYFYLITAARSSFCRQLFVLKYLWRRKIKTNQMTSIKIYGMIDMDKRVALLLVYTCENITRTWCSNKT